MWKWKNNRDAWIVLGLMTILLITIYMITPRGFLFGSETDWLSQHISIPQYFRTQFFATGNLFPDFANSLGGGQNIYNFSYYGLFRPDVLLSFVLPFLDMKTIIISYMIFSACLSVFLCYYWLRKNHYSYQISAISTLFLIFSACFIFQSHRQIMFINFLPWLFLLFISTDIYLKKGTGIGIVISVLMLIMHSYFFSIAAIISALFYYFWRLQDQQKNTYNKEWMYALFRYGLYVFVGILISGVFLLPTALALLASHRSGSNGIALLDLITPAVDANGLLYQPYGCGFTAIAWLCFWIQLKDKKMRGMTIFLILIFVFPFFSYILNGMLYARMKILIVFIPMILFIVASVLTKLKAKEYHLSWYLVIPIIIPLFAYNTAHLYLYDTLFALFLLWFYGHTQNSKVLLITAIAPLVVCFQVNQTEEFVPKKLYNTIYAHEKQMLMRQYQKGNDGRFEDLTQPLNTSNQIFDNDIKKSSSYSSIYNKGYNQFFYDVLHNPIRIKNRVAQLSSPNIFFHGFMGSRFLYTNKNIPFGYELIATASNGDKVVESKHVLPFAYATNNLIHVDDFNKLKYPYTMDSIYNNAVVESDSKNVNKSKMKQEHLNFQIQNQSLDLNLEKIENGYHIKAKKSGSLTLVPNETMENKILLLSFDVDASTQSPKRDTVVDINGIKNRLSSKTAAYPNGNYHFTYVFSSPEDLAQFQVILSKGEYTLTNIKWYSLDYNEIKNRGDMVDPLKQEKNLGKEVLKGSIMVHNDGYFITSIPYDKGFHILVDGKSIESEKVNTAFLGFPITKGKHDIRIEYHAPGKEQGQWLSLIGLLVFSCIIVYEFRRKKNEE